MKASLSRDRMHLGSHVVLIFWTFLVLFPLWTMIVNSFKFKFDIYTDPFGLPKKWNFESYVSVITDGDFFLYFRNSLFVTLGSIFLVLLFGAMASYALVNWKHKASRFLYLFFIAGMMLPIKIGSIRLLQLIKGLGLLNTLWGLFPVYTAMGLPIAVFVLTEFIRQIPAELTEAAVIDGATRNKVFTIIILPLLRPALATVAIYNLIPFWNDLWFPLIFINQDAHKTLLLGVTRLFGQYMTDWSRILAVLTLSAIPVLVLYLTMSKNFIRGLTAGAVKG
ncbi:MULTISPECIES: carbohydrate ABC transporter permease [Treponema]|jgi:binding-protein-dependent transport system inner membrane component|uniref:Carbohydrate ABC transporter permease n=1 Tax=Treponema vincentii TaxID=69710 RepID=A0A6P1Y2E0_9SPIR|nr:MULTISPECIES: carbohydrate ABC transporter permease [Treponema]QHX43911.1 carbohydrate ABC transporter permease [Treponema vincentii]UTC55133.1 carbohydrate ABC transporter permease [Treponema sp. OMZ 906]